MNERKNCLTDFGVSIKTELLKSNKNQNWLIEEIETRYPSIFMDSSLLNKIMTGRVRSGKAVDAIREILCL